MQKPSEHTRTRENRTVGRDGRRETWGAPGGGAASGRPVLLAGEEGDAPDRHVFRGID
ncbi:hypothetical protein OG897_17435 [Streptomyces sp. NBC_00237]|uniref:hypothetical protein n=1 Tax=Streptomyces sp. NBC_00237 TaxID=2975687 RepID=UPI00225237C0|nr:hypothetical protein [Streptomyces sp. NBC_00237]MCX5203220.1 hypothetical protein [Streptomyces sp. NBC_00237]